MAGDRLWVVTDEAAHLMRQVAASGEAMTSGWRSTEARIGSLAGQLGRGVLGAAFMDGYRPAAEDTSAVVARCCAEPGELAGAGDAAIGNYVAADHASARAVESVDGGLDPARRG